MNWFFWPGEKLVNLLKLSKSDDRLAFRIFANVLFWNTVIVLGAVGIALIIY